MKQAEIARDSAEKKATAENDIDMARLKRELEGELWERAKTEFSAERQARKELEDELESERLERRQLAEAFNALKERFSELEAENKRLRADNIALTSELSRYTSNKGGRL